MVNQKLYLYKLML